MDYVLPKISRDQAQQILRRPPGLLKKKREIVKIEIFCLPSYIVDVQVTTGQGPKVQSLCIDAVLGSFAFFELADITPSPPAEFSTCPFFLSETDIQTTAIEEYRRHLLHVGLKMRYQFQIDRIVSCRPIYYPFWIGYFQRQRSIDFDVIDAVGGEHQGVAMRPVFMKALLYEESSRRQG